ncbi:hypothetical protein ROLI_021830 [Roseobacter fucihabitans]|uniref:Uncharacterized protein n=1 Tax=Roseobacter fucihabitans TaxID=1537242 RepID=A0ABZ2BT21_9RHOB|nr:hypothetical protein [Roseobacter litoralis]MBC6967753.1 hypothetical protein [Roseobacter litoralis]
MTDSYWAICALRDIQKSLDTQKYDVATHHIDDAINAITARDAQSDPAPEA